MVKRLKVSVFVVSDGGQDCGFELMATRGGVCKVMPFGTELDGTEDELFSSIKSCALGWVRNQNLNRLFNPLPDVEMDKNCKCEWLESGNLKLRQQDVQKKYQHAETMEEAMTRTGVFTCTYRIYLNLPKRRIPVITEQKDKGN